MADPLSIAASVVGLASVGFEIVKCLYGFADEMGSAGHQMRVYASEIDMFSRNLELIKYPLREMKDAPSPGLFLLKQIIDICEDILRKLEELTKSLSPLLIRFRESKNKLLQFGIRLGWLLSKKEKILFYRATLNEQRHNLTTTMLAIQLQSSQDRSDSSSRHTQGSLESSLLIQTSSKFGDSPTQAMLTHHDYSESSPPNRVPQEMQQRPPASPVQLELTESTSPIDEESISDENQGGLESGALVLRGTRETDSSNSQTEELHQTPSVSGVSTQIVTSADGLTAEDLAEIDQNIEDSLELASLPSTLEIWEEMRVLTRKTIRFAREVLSDQVYSRVPPLETTSGSDGYTMPPVHPSAHGPSPAAADSSTSTRSSVVTEHVAAQDSSNSGAQRANPKSPSTIAKTPETVERVAPTSNSWINVVDSFGNVHACAYEDCNTWEKICVFVDSIKPNFQRFFPTLNSYYIRETKDRYKELVQDRDFHFIGPENTIIPPSTWSRMVQPNWTVRMEFSQDDEFNKNPEFTNGQAEKQLALEKSEAEADKVRAERRNLQLQLQKQEEVGRQESDLRRFKDLSRGKRFLALFK